MPKGKPNKRYTPKFKIKVVETMQKEKLGYCETARQFDISNHNIVASWERIYLEEGPEGLCIERRGRKSTGRPPKLKKKVVEHFISELEDYIEWYNTKRIKLKLDGMSPVDFRLNAA